MKKILSVILSVLMIITSLAVFPIDVFAADVKKNEYEKTLDDGSTIIQGQDGDWEYQVWQDGTVSVSEYNGEDTEITIPTKLSGRSVTSIGNISGSFYSNYTGVKTLNIPAEIVSIKEGCLSNLEYLESINVDSGNTMYSSSNGVLFSKGKWVLYAYPAKKAATSYKISSVVKRIGKCAFYGSGNLQTVTIPDSVVEIRYLAFSISGLTSLTIPASVENIAEGAFGYLPDLSEVKVDSANANYCDYGKNLCSKDKSVLLYRPSGKSATSMTIGAPFKRIGKYAIGSMALKDVTIKEGIEEIGENAFFNCSGIEKITLPNSLKKIEKRAFYGAKITEITIPDGVEEIPYEVFYSCDQLQNVNLPANLKVIGEGVFERCFALNNITIPDGTQKIGKQAFCYCGLKTISLPNSVTELGEGVFSYCDNLQSVKLSEGLTEIPEVAFHDSAIKKITIPDSVTKIGVNAFWDCEKLSSVKLSENLQVIDERAFFSCVNISDITLPESLKSINTYAFYGTNLKKLTVPAGVNHIEGVAFGCTFSGDPLPDFVVYGRNVTTAQTYAEDYGLKFVSLGNILGDVNTDGQVNIFDATAIQCYLAEIISVSADEKVAADFDKNGKVDILDATSIQLSIAEII